MKRKAKFFNLYGRVAKGFDWQLLRSNVKSNELAPLIINYRRTYREVKHREQ